MFVLHDSADSRTVVALFGEGLVGSSILSGLPSRFERGWVDFSYGDGAKQDQEIRELGNHVTRLCTVAPRRLSVVWGAGKAGFSAAESDVESELGIYRRVLAFACRCAEAFPETVCTFHCVTSAGGLYEGQKHVTQSSKPQPLRPYGRLKLAEEEMLLSALTSLRKRIYRLSTVYGYIRKGHRLGLVSTLVYNGVRQEVSRIYGDSNTLRDYVWSGDVGKRIADAIVNDTPDSDDPIEHLVAAKPSSIYEIKRIIEEVLGKKIYISYRESGQNSSDITFSGKMLPGNWHPVDIQTAARAIYSDWKECGGVL